MNAALLPRPKTGWPGGRRWLFKHVSKAYSKVSSVAYIIDHVLNLMVLKGIYWCDYSCAHTTIFLIYNPFIRVSYIFFKWPITDTIFNDTTTMIKKLTASLCKTYYSFIKCNCTRGIHYTIYCFMPSNLISLPRNRKKISIHMGLSFTKRDFQIKLGKNGKRTLHYVSNSGR